MRGRLLYPSLYAAMVVCWGGNWAAIKVGLNDISPLLLAASRTVLGGVFLSSVFLLRNKRSISQFLSKDILVLALLNITIWSVLVHVGLLSIESGLGSVLSYTQPVMVAILSSLFLKERVGLSRVLGIAVALLGTALLLLRGSRELLTFSSGEALMILSALSWAIGTVYYKARVKVGDVKAYNSLQVLVGGLLIFPFVALEKPHFFVTPISIFVLLYSGILGAGIGMMIWFYLLSKVEATRVSANLFLVPLTALVIGWLVLGEELNFFSSIGALLILIGVYLVNRR